MRKPNENVIDITPAHKPLALIREMEQTILDDPTVCTAFVILMDEEGAMIYRGATQRKADLIWALERMKQKILADCEIE